MTTEAERYARIAARFRRLHGEAYGAFLARMRGHEREIGSIATAGASAALEALDAGGSPHDVAHAVDQALREATGNLERQIQRTITDTTNETIRAMAAGNVSIGTALEDHTPGAVQDYRSWDATAARLRAASASRIDPLVRFRARAEPARAQVVAQVRAGLEQGAGIRRMTLAIRSTDTTSIPIPRYVANVIEDLRAGRMPEAAAIRREAARIGSTVEAFATIRPQVERLARAVEAGNLDAIRRTVEDFAARKLRYEATRIARTESARAHTAAQVASVQDVAGVDALEWTLAGSHPVEDICDVYASADLYGLGPGRYPVDNPPMLPAHPNCLCYLAPVITAESIKRDLRGEPRPEPDTPAHDSPEAWLRTQPDHVQDRILGRAVADVLRDGGTVTRPDGSVAPLWELRGTPPPTRAPAMLIPVVQGRIASAFER